MTTFNVTVVFSGGALGQVYDTEVIEDAALRDRLRLGESMSGGLMFETDDDMLVVMDDFEALTSQVLRDLPAALRSGQGLTIELYHHRSQAKVMLEGETVSFDFGDASALAAPRDTVLAALDLAAARLAQIRDLVRPPAA